MPNRLGRYVVQRRIGSGGFATVWLAYDDQLDSPVAVKVLADNWTDDEHVRRRFQEEGRYLRRVESPHVVTVYDAGELDDGRPYLVMTYADQGTLADRLEASRLTGPDAAALTTPQALVVVRQVADGLQALHDRDIVHRDVKPANVLFRSVRSGTDVRAMVGDLGLGKALDMSSRLTLVAGTPSYVAPEQAAAEPVDARADQYSLAAITYLLLTGRPPFAHASLQAAAAPGPLPALSTEGRPFDAAVEDVVRRGLAPARDDRYGSVTDFADALAAALLETTGDLPAVTSPGRPWLPINSDLTLPGARPTASPVPPRPRGSGTAGLSEPSEESPAAMAAATEPGAVQPSVQPPVQSSMQPPAPGTGRGRWWRRGAVALAALVVACGAGVGAYALSNPGGTSTGSVTLDDATGRLSVTVPADWQRYVAADGWVPPQQPEGAKATYPALSVGTTSDWNDAKVHADGVFIGVMAGSQLPGHLPRHPTCVPHDQYTGSTAEGRPEKTLTYTSCPGGVVVERAILLLGERVLWIQVHSSDEDEAYDVLASVRIAG